MILAPIAELFRSGVVTKNFYDLGLSRLGFEHPTFGVEHSNRLPHRHGQKSNNVIQMAI